MSAWDLAVSLAGRHLLPSVLASAIVFVVLALLFNAGRLRRPADRVVFLYAAIVKAALAALSGSAVSCLTYYPYPGTFGYVGLCLPDVVPDGVLFDGGTHALVRSDIAGAIAVGVLLLAAIRLGQRWARLSPAYRAVYEAREADAAETAPLRGVFEHLVGRAYLGTRWLPRPRLLVVRSRLSMAFCMGVRSPVVVLSTGLVRELGDRELRGMLAHELAHARRMDYLGRWIATILRDVMVWNPFVLAWYNQLLDEQEKASDAYAAQLLGDPVAVASGLVEIAAHTRHLPVVSIGPPALRLSPGQSKLRRRLECLQGTTESPPRTAPWPPPLLYVVLAAFFAAQPGVAVSLLNLAELARRVL